MDEVKKNVNEYVYTPFYLLSLLSNPKIHWQQPTILLHWLLSVLTRKFHIAYPPLRDKFQT